MLKFESFFKNHFANPKISLNELKMFTEDHLQRITTNNPGSILDPIVAPTGAAYNAYFGALSNKDVSFAVQQALTVNVDNKMAAFKQAVSRQEGTIRAAFGKDGPGYQEFFPLGLTEYTTATKENVELLMQRFVSASNNQAGSLPMGFAMQFLTLRNEYQDARTAQLGRKALVADGADTARALRSTLEVQLVANMHFIGYQYPGNVSQCMAYFSQSILEEDSNSGGIDGVVAAGETVNIATVTYVASKQIRMKNTGSVPLTFTLRVDPAVSAGTPIIVVPGGEETMTMVMLNANPLATNLMVENPSMSLGNYEVTVG